MMDDKGKPVVKRTVSIKDIRPRKYSEESFEGSRRSQNLQSILMCHRKNFTMAMDVRTDVESLHRPVYKKKDRRISLMEKVGKGGRCGRKSNWIICC